MGKARALDKDDDDNLHDKRAEVFYTLLHKTPHRAQTQVPLSNTQVTG